MTFLLVNMADQTNWQALFLREEKLRRVLN